MGDVLCHMCGVNREQSDEHHFPKWMRKIIPIAKTDSFNYATGVTHNKDVGVRTIREICKVCNEGWMAKLQDRAKPALAPRLKTTRRSQISQAEASIIARWFTMFTMVYENDNPARFFAVPAIQRQQFADDQVVPGDWNIWLGFTKQRLNGGRGASHLPASREMPDGSRYRCQTTIGQFGQLILMSYSGGMPAVGEDSLRSWGMIRLFPLLDDRSKVSLARFPQGFQPRILADVLNGFFSTPTSAAGHMMGLRPFAEPPPGFLP